MIKDHNTLTTRSDAIADCTARRVCNVKRASFLLLLLVGVFRPKFYGNVVIPAKMLIPFDR